jgi:hypothetical protein
MTAAPIATLEKFADLAREFLAAAETADLASMDAILARRRRLLERLTEAPPTGAGSNGSEERRRELLEAILELDRRSGKQLAEHRDEAGRELSRLEEGRRGLGGYRAGVRAGAKWIDARG